MEKFEVHITGDESILFHSAKHSLKAITIDLVKPDKSYFRTEYMTSQVMDARNYNACKEMVDRIVSVFEKSGVQIKRIKIECPYYKHYVDKSLYMEIHAPSESNEFPLSRNKGKDYYLMTEREYDKSKYKALMTKNAFTHQGVLELCLYDSDVDEDKDWFDLYKEQ